MEEGVDVHQDALIYFFHSQSLNMPVLTLSPVSPTHTCRVTLQAGLDAAHPSGRLALRIIGPKYELSVTLRTLLNGV